MKTAVLAILFALIPVAASAQDAPAGAVQAQLYASPAGDFGGGVSADIWVPIDFFRIGGVFGVGVVPSADDAQNRVFMPLGASVGVELVDRILGVSLRARGGLWGGATQASKLTIGGFVSGGAYLLFNLGPGVAAAVGLEIYGLFGDGDTALFAPGAGLTWNPAIGRDE
jgi:hypothetical protein